MQSLCLVIPCFNEAARLPIKTLEGFYDTHGRISFYLVNDGSQDGTLAVLESFALGRERVKILDLIENQGKAEAVRQGMLAAAAWQDFDYIGYFDADLATPLEEVDYFQAFCGGMLSHPIVVGSRIKRMGARIRRKVLRHYLGRVFSTAASVILRLPIYDTQCGAKMVQRSLVPILFEHPFLSRWLFDIEVFARAIQYYGPKRVRASIMEIPLSTWIEKGDSRLRPKDLIRVPLELWKIYRYYQQPRVQPKSARVPEKSSLS